MGNGPTARQARSQVALSTRHHGKDSPQARAARAQLDQVIAVRALDDPATLQRAARIVRVALERQRLTLADVVTPGGDA